MFIAGVTGPELLTAIGVPIAIILGAILGLWLSRKTLVSSMNKGRKNGLTLRLKMGGKLTQEEKAWLEEYNRKNNES